MTSSSSQAKAPLLPQFNPSSSPSTSPSVSERSQRRASSSADLQNMKQSRLTLARSMLLICISFMLMALVHIQYTNNIYRHKEEEYANSEQTVNHSNEPIYTNGGHDDNNPAPHKIEPSFTTYDTTLATTYTYSNGTRTKEFKPAFYQSAALAQEEMGSFLKTLETRTWWPAPHREEVAARGLPATNKFFSYLPMGGGNNQFTSLQRAALLAKDLGRTLIIPPISPNSHIKVRNPSNRHSTAKPTDRQTDAQSCEAPIFHPHPFDIPPRPCWLFVCPPTHTPITLLFTGHHH